MARPKRRRDRLRQFFGLSSSDTSLASRPNGQQSSPSITPQALSRAATPQHISETPLPPTTIYLGSGTTVNAPAGALSLVPVSSHALLDDPAPITNPPDPQPGPITQANPTESGARKTKSVAWSGFKTLLKLVESGAEVFGPLKAAVTGLNQCIDIFERAAKGKKDYEELQTKLDSLAKDLAEFLGNPSNVKMTRSMNIISTAIEQELKLITEKSARGAVEGLAEALEDADTIMGCYQRIQGHLNRLAASICFLLIVTLNANLEIWSAVSQLTEGLMDTRLQRISPSPTALYDSAESAIAVQRGKCTPGTRIPEIDKLLTWAHNPQSQNVFWMNGMAGTGKTTIAYSVCAELEKKEALGACFFCSRSMPECRNVNLIVPAIAYQLAQFSYPYRCAVSKVLETEFDIHARALERQFDSLLVKPLQKVKHTLPKDFKFVVVIDALDECKNTESVAKILSILLPPTPDSALPLRFLISSRPDHGIYSHMMAQVGDSLSARLVLHDLDDQAVRGDIETYLRDELKEINLTPAQLAGLVERAGVLFIFASTAARYIKAGLYLKARQKRLDMILGLVPAPTGSNGWGVDKLYSPILGAALEDQYLDDDDRALTKTLLDAVICLQEPMTVGALASLLELDGSEQVEALLRPLSSVLNISESSGLVTTLHASFPDYMLNQNRSQSLWCDSAINHLRLAQACFKAINSSGQSFNLCALESSYIADSDLEGLAERASQTIPTELFYACRFWMSHTEAYKSQDLEQPLFEFLSNRLMLWMEVLNLKKCMSLGPGIMRRAEIWSRDSKCEAKTTELAHDAWRFVSMFAGHAVSKSTAHIYISMLPFWPEDTPVSRHYARRADMTNGAHGTAMTRRQLTNLATWTYKDRVMVACFSPDNSLVAYSTGSSIYLVDSSTGSAVSGPLAHDDTVLSVVFSPDGTHLASGSEDRSVRVWNTSTGQAVVDPMTKHTGQISSVCFTPDGARIVSGSSDNTIRIWNWRDNIVLGPFEGHSDWVRSVCVSPDGTRVVSGSDDNTIRLWDIESGKTVLEPCGGHTGYIRSACFSPDGSRIVSGSDDRTIRIWSAQTGQQLAEPFEGHTSPVTSVTFSPDGKQIVSGSWDNAIRLWGTDGTSESVRQFDGHTDWVNSVAFSSDGTRILSCSNDDTVRVWDARSKAVVDTPLEAHTRGVSSVCFSHDGTRILSASSDATVRVWDARSGNPLLEPLTGHSNSTNCARFSPDGTRIAAGSADHTVQLWDSETGQPAGEPLAGHSDDVNALCFSPDGALIVSGSDDQAIRVWSTQTGKSTTEPLMGHTEWVFSVCFSPDGTRLVSGSGDKTVRVWKVKTGKLALDPLEGHTNMIWSVRFSPDGTRIASASSDASIRLWDSSTGKTVGDPLEGHTGAVKSVCFSPTGECIASGSDDKTIRLWDAHTGVAIGVLLTGHTSQIWSVVFSPNGSQIVSGSDDATIRVFDVSDLSTLRSKASSSSPPNENQDALTFACQPWVLQEDGWVVDAQSRLLAWVPLDLHTRLLRPRNTLLISASGSFKIELDHEKLGEGWTGCYKP